MKANLNSSTETPKNSFPSSGELAQDLILSRPDLFQNNYSTVVAIAESMVEYQQAMNRFENQRSIN